MKHAALLQPINDYFRARLREHGPTARGADWNSPEAQRLRFAQLLRLCDTSQPFALLDYGCGYGALAGFLMEQGVSCRYTGYDICSDMIRQARSLFAACAHCQFYDDDALLEPADYCVASGIFNIRLAAGLEEWQEHVLQTLDRMNRLGARGFAYNLLTRYADPERMRGDLYYADPCFYFDHCKTRYSQQVALLHDYGAFDFTILVRK
jgi:SAM-dependent methyltransferase